MIKRVDDTIGEVICALMEYMTESREYEKEMTKRDFLAEYEDLVTRAVEHGQKRDKKT